MLVGLQMWTLLMIREKRVVAMRRKVGGQTKRQNMCPVEGEEEGLVGFSESIRESEMAGVEVEKGRIELERERMVMEEGRVGRWKGCTSVRREEW